MFSMLGVNLAYVTAIGKLIGVVGLKELRSGIENANSGILARSNSNKSSDTTTSKEGMNQFTFSVNSLSIYSFKIFVSMVYYFRFITKHTKIRCWNGWRPKVWSTGIRWWTNWTCTKWKISFITDQITKNWTCYE